MWVCAAAAAAAARGPQVGNLTGVLRETNGVLTWFGRQRSPARHTDEGLRLNVGPDTQH